MACRLLSAGGPGERMCLAIGRPAAPGSGPPAPAGRAAFRAPIAQPAERSVRSSRWPRTPASSPAHSRWRPTIQDAVSLSGGSADAEQAGDERWLEPAGFHLVQCHQGAADGAGVVAFQAGGGRLGVGDLDQGISERMFEPRSPGRPRRPEERGHGRSSRRFAPVPPRRRGGCASKRLRAN